MNRKLSLILASSLLAAACGYSEDEWQAQLDKYAQLDSRFKGEQSEHAATRAELEDAKVRVSQLEKRLQDLGVNLDELNKQLDAEGAEKARLSASLDETQRALAAYKARADQLERIRQRFETLKNKLQQLTTIGLKVSIRNNRMVISLPGDVLFASGQDRLRKEGVDVLAQVANVIRTDGTLSKRFFQVAGHTDHIALKGGQFKDNWGLSAMRARQVLVYLVAPQDSKDGGGGLDPKRLHAAGYGDTDPVETNETTEGRQANRRVELVLMPDVEEMLDLRDL